MKHNVWDEQEMSDPVHKFHEEQVAEMKLPKWLSDLSCPFCNEELPLRSIRRVSICLNARNFGDLAVEFSCDNCATMDTIYYREDMGSVIVFANMLRGDFGPLDTSPNVEEKMFKLQYNNLLERMVRAQNAEGEN
jgi:hypothetical protein